MKKLILASLAILLLATSTTYAGSPDGKKRGGADAVKLGGPLVMQVVKHPATYVHFPAFPKVKHSYSIVNCRLTITAINLHS